MQHTHMHRVAQRETMEDIDGMVFLILGMWLFVTARKQFLYQKRLEAVRRNTAEKYPSVWEILHLSSDHPGCPKAVQNMGRAWVCVVQGILCVLAVTKYLSDTSALT